MPHMWQPPDAVALLSTVIVPGHLARRPLTKAEYRGLLKSRIAKMAESATWDDLQMLDMAKAESLDIAGLKPDQVAEVLMRDSEALTMALSLSEG